VVRDPLLPFVLDPACHPESGRPSLANGGDDVAWFLASYARDALARIGLHELPALASLRKALEEALSLTFEGEKGEHFFRSTLVQTLFYGVFSAWVLWSKQHPPGSKERFEWAQTARLLRVPVLRKLFFEVTDPGQLEKLNLNEILDWTSSVLNRVDRAVFFARFEEGHAVQYFYEPFLRAAYWCNIPARVWEYTIGGYQVIKKWRSYREKPLLGRALTVDEARYVQEMARRIAAILLLEPALDANYESIKANTFSWPPES
jgi:hypothetical protein